MKTLACAARWLVRRHWHTMQLPGVTCICQSLSPALAASAATRSRSRLRRRDPGCRQDHCAERIMV
jgi:hypothetical protein